MATIPTSASNAAADRPGPETEPEEPIVNQTSRDSAECPDSAEVARLARNELSPDRTSAVEAHLSGCSTCLDRYLTRCGTLQIPAIPDCHIVKEIGRGRFGVVYKAWWLRDEPKLVALKLLSSGGDMERGRFEREIAVLSKIESPSIVKCLGSGVSGDVEYFIMDYVEGVHLHDYLARSTGGLNKQLSVFQEVCRAVADAHDAGVVHRDLKSRNILIDASGRPHVLDFGICSLDSADWSSWKRCTITQVGDVIGTLKYMSPEQAWGGVAGRVDERSDIWALGVMLYEIVTDGDYPYELSATRDKSAQEALLERIRKELPRRPRLEHLPRGRDLEILLDRCLSWEPDHRIPSARRLADDLGRYVGGGRIKTKPLWLPYRLQRLAVGAAARSRWAFSAVSLAAVVVILWLSTLMLGVGWKLPVDALRRRADPSAPITTVSGVRENMVIVAINDETVDPVVEFASRRGIAGVTAQVPTWRAVHARVLERFVQAGPAAVVWDYYFKSPRSSDAHLAQAILELERAGIPVVLAAFDYRDDDAPDLSPGLTGPLGTRLRHGAITARDMVRRPGQFVLAIKRTAERIIPSLALTTLAAVLHRNAHLDMEWPGRKPWMNLLYEIRPGAYLRVRDRLELARVYESSWTQQAARPGDLLACGRFALERPERWERRTVAYQRLLSCSDDALRELVQRKVVLFGDLRKPRFGFSADRHRVRYDTTVVDQVPGVYLLGDAIAGLLEGRYMTMAHPLPPTTLATLLLFGGVGCLIPIRLAASAPFERRRHRRVLWVSLSALLAVCWFVMVHATGMVTVHASMAGLSLLVPMLGSFWVEFARNRHRILERNRRSIEDLEPTVMAEGTITLPSRQRTSHPPEE